MLTSILSFFCLASDVGKQVENQEIVVNIWKKSLNPLTWTEVLRQVLVAAGFGSKHGASQREAISEVCSS